MEIIQEQKVVIKIDKKEVNVEKLWDVRLILEQEFITLAEKQKIIMPIRFIKHFVQEPVRMKQIIWHPNIYMTFNYIKSVQISITESIHNYLRPVDVVLIHRTKDKSRAVLLSGKEVSKIKSKCYEELQNNLLVHIHDIDGPTQLPVSSSVSNEELKLLTIIKLFSGECQYASEKEVLRLAKRMGRLHPHSFTNPTIDRDHSSELYGILIEKGYLNYLGIMTEKLLRVLHQVRSGEPTMFDVTGEENHSHYEFLLKKLSSIYSKLIIEPSGSLIEDRYILWHWVGTRGRLKEYSGSALESIIDSENIIQNYH